MTSAARPTSGRVRKSGGSARGAPGATAGAWQPLAYWWYVCGCRVPAGAVGARENPSDLRTGPLAAAVRRVRPRRDQQRHVVVLAGRADAEAHRHDVQER